jgi:lipid-A-disaccharide synthase-like uncharacterized protein
MDTEVVAYFPYTAITVSILARFIFFYLLYRNRSANTYSLTFCLMNIGASSLWIVYSLHQRDDAMVYRSATEIGLLALSSSYIVYNKCKARRTVLPLPVVQGQMQGQQ